MPNTTLLIDVLHRLAQHAGAGHLHADIERLNEAEAETPTSTGEIVEAAAPQETAPAS